LASAMSSQAIFALRIRPTPGNRRSGARPSSAALQELASV
jgi:hypothetical protein